MKVPDDEKAIDQLGAILYGLALCAIASREKTNGERAEKHMILHDARQEAEAIVTAMTEKLKSI